MRIRGSANSRRVMRAPGMSTPITFARPEREATTMPAVHARFDGVPVKDKALAELLLRAEAQGFRMEESANGGHARGTGLRVYPPDPAHTPFSVGTAKSNPGHLANVRSSLRQAGYVDEIDLADTATTTRQEQDMSKNKQRRDDHTHTTLDDALRDIPVEEQPEFVAHLAAASVQKIGAKPGVAALVGVLVENLAAWAIDPIIVDRLASEFGTGSQQQVDDALAMAAAAEERAVAAEQALAKAEAREQQARKDCGDAIKRAEAAEAEAARVTAALKPLRALLGEAS